MKFTIDLTETGGLTAGTLEVARVARAISCTKERMQIAADEIGRTKARLKLHLKRFRADQRARVKRLAAQQKELRFQMKRLKAMPGAVPTKC